MKTSPALDREQLMELFGESSPFSTCDFILQIDDPTLGVEQFPCIGFTLPQAGVVVKSLEKLSHAHFEFNFDSKVDISFLVPRKYTSESSSIFSQMYSRQFWPSGIPKFIPVSKRPTVMIYPFEKGRSSYIFMGKGCLVSSPLPKIDFKSDSAAEFTVTFQPEEFNQLPI